MQRIVLLSMNILIFFRYNLFENAKDVFNPIDNNNDGVPQPVVFSTSSCTMDFVEIESSGESCSRFDRLLHFKDKHAIALPIYSDKIIFVQDKINILLDKFFFS